MSSTPPPPPGQSPPPPGAYGSDRLPPPPPPSYQAPPSATWGGQRAKPPAPRCPVGAWLMIAGGVAVIIGCFLPWFSIGDETVNGFTDLSPGNSSDGDTSDGYVFAVLGAAVLGFGITTLFARRLLPIAILAVVLASFCVLGSIADLSDVSDLSDLFAGVSVGAGLPIVLIGALAGLAGGIVALATRRR